MRFEGASGKRLSSADDLSLFFSYRFDNDNDDQLG